MAIAKKISITNAKQDKQFYFVANAVVCRESDARCLILIRRDHEKVHPNRYAVPGDKLGWNDLNIAKPTRINSDVLDFENAVENLLILLRTLFSIQQAKSASN